MTNRVMQTLKFAPFLLAMAAVTAPALARDHDRGHDRDRREHSRGHDRDRGHDRGRDDRRWHGDGRGSGSDYRRWADRDRDGRYRHEHWNRPPPVLYHRPPPRVVYRPRPPVAYRPGTAYHRPPSWVRGRDYRSYGYRNVYYVPYDRYSQYRLYRPNHGYRWVRDDYGNFLLVAAATGIITSVLLNHAY